ncbi:MAG: type I glyceraldehyde-3-phosphate dehydrogenase, partial [Bilophila wadsworthia]
NCVMKRDVTVDEVNAALTAAANDNFGVSDEPLVSIDYNGDTHGGVVDLLSTSVMSGNMLKVLIWYDNEAGFTNQLLRLITMVGGKM